MDPYTFRMDNTEGYTQAELDALNVEMEAYIEEQREYAESRGRLYDRDDEVQDMKHFADIVASR